MNRIIYQITKAGIRTNTAYESEQDAKDFCAEHPAYDYDILKYIEAKKKVIRKPKAINDVVYPNKEMIEAFATQKGYKVDAELIIKIYTFEGDVWKDTNGRIVKNWKQKLISVWFTDERRIVPILNGSVQPEIFACQYAWESRICIFSREDIKKKLETERVRPERNSKIESVKIISEYQKGKRSLTVDEYGKLK